VPVSKLALAGHAPSSASTSATSGTPEASRAADLGLRPDHSNRSEPLVPAMSGSFQTAGSLQLPAKAAEQAPWAVGHSFRLGPSAEIGQARLLDRTAVSSVSGAVDQLNRGLVSCPEGVCVVYSAVHCAYYCLHRPEKREAALALFRRQLEEDFPKPKASYASNGKARTRGAVHVRRISSMPVMGESLPGNMGLDSVDNEERFRSPKFTDVHLEGAGSGMAASDADAQETPERPAVVYESGSAEVQRYPRLPPRHVEGRVRAVSPDRILQRTTPDKASPPPLNVRRAEQSSPSISSMRSAITSPGLKPSRQETAPAVQRASSAHSSGPSSHFSPRMRKRVLGHSSPQARLATRPLMTRGLGSASDAETPRTSSVECSVARNFEKDFECEVDINRRTFQLIEVIGRGAFGVVWLARERDAPQKREIAVKAITTKDASGFATAAFEAELLQILTAAMPAASRVHVPQYVAHSSTRTAGGGGGIVRLAMSFVPGGALDKWLYGISDEEHKTVDVAQLVDGHLPGGQQGSWMFTNSCVIVRHLLSQLSSVFAALQPIAYHRDVSSHNVLVHFLDDDPLRPNFALIDFGLAVRSGSWIREWRNSNLAGDPRYWTPSAWMAFAFGFKYVATHPNSGFQQQYLGRMDHFSLGVLGLEALFALWHTGEAYEGKHPGLLEVRAAWCKYWVAVIHLFQMFHRQGAQEVRQFLAQSQDEGVTCLCNHLRQLRQSLRTAAVHPLNARCAALLRVLADLIDERGTVSWNEVPQMLAEDGEDISNQTPRYAAPVEQARSSMALVDTTLNSPMEHRRIRSTGGTLDQELRRFEPEISQVLFKTMQTQPQWGSLSTNTCSSSYSVDMLSRSFTHARPLSGYM